MPPLAHRLLTFRVWLFEHFRPGERTFTLIWAASIGCLGGLAGVSFRKASEFAQWCFTHRTGSLVDVAEDLSWEQRLFIPMIGGLLAGLVLHFGSRLTRGRPARDYMEAISLGDGLIRTRPVLVRTTSSLISIASGASIGREGAMTQLAAMVASLVGQIAKFPRPRLRLLVGCGAAAGIAAAYNAPIGGALFVAEVVLGSIAMESFGPLLLAAAMSTVVAHATLGDTALFTVRRFELVSALELLAYVALGLVAGCAAPLFLRGLEAADRAFNAIPFPIWGRMTIGGVLIGVLSVQHPYVWGNGYESLVRIIDVDWVWVTLLALLAVKVLATFASVGSGAVGGVFTTTLLVGGAIGALVGTPIHAALPGLTAEPHAYAVVGMGAFLAATTHAPLMAILIMFDMTLNREIILPLMVACVAAYTASRALRKNSIYGDVLARGDGSRTQAKLAVLRVRDLLRPDPPNVRERDRFDLITATFSRHQHHNLYVVDDNGRFQGVISLHEIKPFLHDPRLAGLVIAHDLTIQDFPVVAPESSLGEALEKFSRYSGERLPVVDPEGGWLVGSISKTDLMLTLAHDVQGTNVKSPRAKPTAPAAADAPT